MALIKIEGKANLQGKTIFEAGPQLPSDIAGLQLWLDATTGLYNATTGGSLVTTDSTAVARWEDRSGNGQHFIQGTANNRPLLKTAQLNGKNIVSFDGTNDALANASSTLLRNVSGYTVFILRKDRVAHTGAAKVTFTNASGLGQRFDFSTQTTNKFVVRARRLSTDTLTTLSASNNNTTAGTYEMFCGLVDHTNTTCKLFKNGTLISSSTNFLTQGNTNDSSYYTAVGAYSVGGASPDDIDVAEILVYHGALSDANRNVVESYLSTKWGI